MLTICKGLVYFPAKLHEAGLYPQQSCKRLTALCQQSSERQAASFQQRCKRVVAVRNAAELQEGGNKCDCKSGVILIIIFSTLTVLSSSVVQILLALSAFSSLISPYRNNEYYLLLLFPSCLFTSSPFLYHLFSFLVTVFSKFITYFFFIIFPLTSLIAFHYCLSPDLSNL